MEFPQEDDHENQFEPPREEEKFAEIQYDKVPSQQRGQQQRNPDTQAPNHHQFPNPNFFFDQFNDQIDDESEFATEKYEYFHAQNLLILMKLASLQSYIEDPKTCHLKEQLEHYWYSSDFNAQRARVVYRYSKKQAEYQTGRLYSWTESRFHKNREKMVGLQSFPKWVRAALASEYYFDLDIVNAHPSILLSVARQLVCFRGENPIEFPNLEFYCRSREQVLDLMSQYLNLGPVQGLESNRKESKQAITALFFGGRLPTTGDPRFKFINQIFHFDKLIAEISQIGKILLAEASNTAELAKSELIEYAQGISPQIKMLLSIQKNYRYMKSEILERKKAAEEEAGEENYGDDHPQNSSFDFSRSDMFKFLARFLQDFERMIMHQIENTLEKGGEREVDVYIHDGCLIRKKLISNNSGYGLIDWDSNTLRDQNNKSLNFEKIFSEELIELCVEKIFQEFAVEIRLVVQPFDAKEFKDRIQISHLVGYNNDSIKLQAPLKTFEELCYYYETCRNLCFVTDRNKFLYGTELIPIETLKNCLDEQNFRKPEIQNKSFSFIDAYQKQNVKTKYGKIELVKSTTATSKMNSFASFRFKSNPFGVLNSSKNSTLDLVKFLLDLETGFPLFLKQNQVNASLESMEEFRNYLALDAEDDNDRLCLLPLFPLKIFYIIQQQQRQERKHQQQQQSLLLFDQYPMAIPYFNHWWMLLGKDEICFEYVVLWIAKIAISPGDMSNISGLVFYSKKQGIGKSLAIKMTLSLFDPFVQETQSVEQVFARFSDLMEFVLLLHIEDAPKQHLHQHQDELKARITADKIFVEKKNQPMYNVTNFCRIMLSTNEDWSLELTPDDRRWAAFECSPSLYQKRGYFDDLARYWKLHQSKCEVMRVLQALSINKFDAEKQRPKTPYLTKLMKGRIRETTAESKLSSNGLLLFGRSDGGNDRNLIEETLVLSFIEGMKVCLSKSSPRKIKSTFPALDIFHSEHLKEESKYSNSAAAYTKSKSTSQSHSSTIATSHYYIKYSVLADLFYIWMYGFKSLGGTGTAAISHLLGCVLRDNSKKNKMYQEFKRVLLQVAPEVTSHNFPAKRKYSYYIIDPKIRSTITIMTSQYKVNQSVDLFALYQERNLQWKELNENLSSNEEKSLSSSHQEYDYSLPNEIQNHLKSQHQLQKPQSLSQLHPYPHKQQRSPQQRHHQQYQQQPQPKKATGFEWNGFSFEDEADNKENSMNFGDWERILEKEAQEISQKQQQQGSNKLLNFNASNENSFSNFINDL